MKTSITLFITLLSFSIVRAQNAGNWTLNNTLNGTAASHMTVGVLSLGSSIPTNTFNSSTEWYGENGWTAANAPDPNGYVQFTLTSNSGYYLVLNTVTLLQRRSNLGTPQGGGPNTWSLRSSLDNYTTDITTGSLSINYTTYTVTLPAAFQSIPSTVTFRLYGYSATVNSGSANRFVFDNISVQGQANVGILASQSIHLSALTDNNTIDLSWNTTGFAAGSSFSLQRSSNGSDFTTIFHAESIAEYKDATAPATAYYRMTAALPDGSTYFSPIVSVKKEETGKTAIKGVAAQGSAIRTFLHLEGSGAYQISIWSQDGKPLVRQAINGQEGDIQSDIAFSGYPHGVYIMTLSKEGRVASRQFLF